ncbi:Transcription factor transcription regulator protein [Polymorphum gilvum SL003B-26A1]|uniref:Transcription factor transcription regulator protein n=1 Tax=Polymorphum gilvum (strain LMG 25793 / CGMCC 1.9160 / SL003B-26A1) TaxID=991905 RepID=F2IZJ3_POLGS|nr:Transcription factor transcription regulator protein [Polymorphum gilvum SL003B-26A1]
MAEANGFAGAARLVNMSQPAITRAVQSLEAELGASLFHRTSRTLGMTGAGRLLTQRARRAQDYLKAAEAELHAFDRQAPERTNMLAQHAADHEFAALLAIAESGSISAAARAAGPSQPALNKSLRTLEERIGHTLFHRTSNGMRLTPAGEILLRRVKLARSEIRQAVEEIRYLRGEAGGRIRIGALPLTRVQLVPLAIENLLETFPLAEVAIVDGTYEVLLKALRNGDIDILAGTIRRPAPVEGLNSEELFLDDVAIVACADHPLAGRERVDLADCLDHGWILPFQGVPLRQKFEETLRDRGLSAPQNVIEADSIVAVRSLLMRGSRLAILSRHQVHYEVIWGVLKILPVDLPDVMRPVGTTVRADFSPTPAAAALLDALRAAALVVSAQPARLSAGIL